MLAEPGKWPYQFGLTFSVTLSSEELETSLVVRNTGSKTYDFQVLFHTYLAVDVSPDLVFQSDTVSSLSGAHATRRGADSPTP